jgi:hypothetical protein
MTGELIDDPIIILEILNPDWQFTTLYAGEISGRLVYGLEVQPPDAEKWRNACKSKHLTSERDIVPAVFIGKARRELAAWAVRKIPGIKKPEAP